MRGRQLRLKSREVEENAQRTEMSFRGRRKQAGWGRREEVRATHTAHGKEYVQPVAMSSGVTEKNSRRHCRCERSRRRLGQV